MDLYKTTRTPVQVILRETGISSSELYRELKEDNIPLRGLSGWEKEVALSKDEAKEVIRAMAIDGQTVYTLTRLKKMERSTLYRAITEHLLTSMKNGEDVREWLS